MKSSRRASYSLDVVVVGRTNLRRIRGGLSEKKRSLRTNILRIRELRKRIQRETSRMRLARQVGLRTRLRVWMLGGHKKVNFELGDRTKVNFELGDRKIQLVDVDGCSVRKWVDHKKNLSFLIHVHYCVIRNAAGEKINKMQITIHYFHYSCILLVDHIVDCPDKMRTTMSRTEFHHHALGDHSLSEN